MNIGFPERSASYAPLQNRRVTYAPPAWGAYVPPMPPTALIPPHEGVLRQAGEDVARGDQAGAGQPQQDAHQATGAWGSMHEN